MRCLAFGICGSCTLYDKSYDEQLEFKISKIKDLFKLDSIDIIRSKSSNFRDRAEFRVYHDNQGISYAMNSFKRSIVKIDECSIVSSSISKIMKPLLLDIESIDILKKRLFAIEFISSTTSELLITLIYHKKIDHIWEIEAKKLASKFNINIVGRSRKVKIVTKKDYIYESLNISGKEYRYRVYDTGFTQPNSGVNIKMIEWVKSRVKNREKDLLELYCGHGNFTIPLSENFRKTLATEISKSSIKSAEINSKINGIENISFVRLSSQELAQALQKRRDFRRLKDIDLDSFSFDAVFVDPPRAGVDKDTLEFLNRFRYIIYISCNPKTLKRDLEYLIKSRYRVEEFALFDQFAYTEHIECGVILKKI